MANAYDLNSDAERTLLVAADGSVLVTTNGIITHEKPADHGLTQTAAISTGFTATLAAPAAGLFIYIDYYQIVLIASTGGMTGAAAPILVTTTNLPGGLVHSFGNALAIGQQLEQKFEGRAPFKASAAATAVTFIFPVATNGIWRFNALWHTGP